MNSSDRKPLSEVTNTNGHVSNEETKQGKLEKSGGHGAPNQKRQQREKTNKIQVASSKPANFYVYLSKMYMKDYESIEIHALGNAVSTAVLASENLIR